MSKRDYYEVLGVSRTVTEAELKVAYRRAAAKHHPDRNPGNVAEAELAFKECKEAYEVLSDPAKRRAYDQQGHAAFEHGMGGGAGGFHDVGDIFGDIFGNIFVAGWAVARNARAVAPTSVTGWTLTSKKRLPAPKRRSSCRRWPNAATAAGRARKTASSTAAASVAGAARW